MFSPASRRRTAVIAACGIAGFLVLWLLLFVGPVSDGEAAFLARIGDIRTDGLTLAAVWTTNIGSINLLVPLSVLTSAGLLFARRWRLGLLFLATLLWYPVLLPLRLAIDRPAPPAGLRSSTKGVIYLAEAPLERAGRRQEEPPGLQPPAPAAGPPLSSPWYSRLVAILYRSLTRGFPSNHAATSAYFYGLCLLLAWNRRWRLASWALATLIGMIGASRVYMGVHYPTDVLGSWSLALAALAGARWLLGRPLQAARGPGSEDRGAARAAR